MAKQPLAQQILFEVDGFTAEMCLSEESLNTAFALRYDAYRHSEAISENSTGLFFDEYDAQSNSSTYLIWHDHVPIASLRICLWCPRYAWESSEMIRIYPSEIQRFTGLYQILQESGRYVVAPDIKGRLSLKAQMLMFRIHAIVSQVESSHWILTGVRKKHAPFYQRMLAFETISVPRYVEWIDEEVVLMAARRDKSYETFLNKNGSPITQADIDNYRNLQAFISHPQSFSPYANIHG